MLNGGICRQLGEIRKIQFPRAMVGGLPIAALDRQDTAKLMVKAALSRRGSGWPCLYFTTVNGHVVSICASEPFVRQLFEMADLISADGMSVVLASRLGPGHRLPERVATTDAFHDAARIASTVDVSFYFLGATEEVNARAVERTRTDYPRLRIAGRQHGFFRSEDEEEVVEAINAAAPDVLWVGLGVPRQQQFIVRHRERLKSVGVAKSCGGLFDFLAGRNRRAPVWMQKVGLEWAHRALVEPRRLVWRYLKTNPHAAYYLLRWRDHAGEGAIDVNDLNST